MIIRRLLEIFFSVLLHYSSSIIFACMSLILWYVWETISGCFSTILDLSTIFFISLKHSIFTSYRFSYCSKILACSGVVSLSTFLLFLTFSLRLMISFFRLSLSDSASEIFSLIILTLWEVAWDKADEVVSTVIGFSSVFSNRNSSSCISSRVPSFFF